RLGVRAGPGGAGEELQVGAGVRLHRAGDVAQEHEPARLDAAAAVRETDRVAGRVQAAAERAAQVDALAAAALSVAGRAARRRLQPQARHQRVELRELGRLERVEVLRRQTLLVARKRHGHLDRLAVALLAAGCRRTQALRRRAVGARRAAVLARRRTA